MNFIFLCENLKEMILLCMDWHRSDFHHLQQKSDPSMKRQWIENIRPEGKTDIQMKTIEIFLLNLHRELGLNIFSLTQEWSAKKSRFNSCLHNNISKEVLST